MDEFSCMHNPRCTSPAHRGDICMACQAGQEIERLQDEVASLTADLAAANEEVEHWKIVSMHRDAVMNACEDRITELKAQLDDYLDLTNDIRNYLDDQGLVGSLMALKQFDDVRIAKGEGRRG